MKRDLRTIINITLLAALTLPQLARAQTYEIPASVVGSGGGTSSGGSYSLSGTVGQPAAEVGLTGGTYNHDGGFWPAAQALTASISTSPLDSLALVALYNSAGGTGWTNTWDLYALVSTWYGVTISGGRVKELNLQNNNLSGSIPAAIGILDSLTYLDLGNNQLTGEIPVEIGNLGNLTDLRLNSNELSGPIPTAIGSLTGLTYLNLYNNQLTGPIPTWIGNLTGLTFLDLSYNPLAGEIPTEIGSLVNLTNLRLRGNQLTGPIPAQIGNLTNLNSLYLYSNQLTDPIPAQIGNLTNLNSLYLNDNQLTDPIPAQIGNLTNLNYLNLQGNQFTGFIPDAIGSLSALSGLGINSFQLPGNKPDWIVNLTSLTQLYLYGRQESDFLPDWIGTLTQLTSFGLYNHQLSGSIPAWVGNLTNLYNLSIGNNQLTGSIPAEIGNLTNLTNLDLYYNQLTGPIPIEIGNLVNLRYLYIYYNQLSGAVPVEITNLTLLNWLYLRNNQLDDLPDLSSLSSLQYLYVQNNRFTFEDIEPNVYVASEGFFYAPQDSVGAEQDTTVEAGASLTLNVPVGGAFNQYQWMKDGTDIAEATNASLSIAAVAAADVGSYVLRITNTLATELTLYSRPIHVTLPVTVPADSLALVALYNSAGGSGWTNTWDLYALVSTWYGVTVADGRITELELHSNNLSGPIPTAIGNLDSLTYLDLGNNQLTGEIPVEIGNLGNLTYLRLYNNQLSGPIPTAIGNLGNLTYLNLYNNQLTGPIPTTIGSLTSLTTLDLDWNRLDGTIPVEIANLGNLVELRIDGNQLTGSIPTVIYSLTNLTNLRLGYNQLTGTIPVEIGNLINLNSLHLQYNQLTGPIPAQIGYLTNLNYLYLNGNQFTGPIPAEIGYLTNLYYLYLQGNQFTGLIPDAIGGLTTLYGLGINSFQLPGSKPAWIVNLTSLTQLYLYGRQESDFLPVWIGTLTQLTSLGLYNHQLSGGIPTWVGNLTNLYGLSIGNNQLTGSIPAEIGNLTALQYLDLYDNQLTGSIPAEIGNLTALQSLNLYYNQLTGSIPAEIGNLTALQSLYLPYNQLSGAVPAAIADLTQLRYLYLNDNQLDDLPDLSSLSSGIPAEIGSLTNLTNLDLYNNQLTGPLPAEIGNLTALQYPYLYYNQLSGAVPAAIADLTQLRYLYLNDNQLDDLPDLSSLSSLEYLYVQNNRFTFEDIVPNVGLASEEFFYAPQDSVGAEQDTTVEAGASLTLNVPVGGLANQYQWMKDGADIAGATNDSYIIASMSLPDTGSYVLRTTNTIATELTLYSRPMHVTADLDTEKPHITDVTKFTEAVEVGSDITVNAIVTEDREMGKVWLHHSQDGGNSFTANEMLPTGAQADQYGITLQSGMTLKGLVYFVRGVDAAQNADTSATQFVDVRFNAADLATDIAGSAFAGGFPEDRWRLISIPANLANNAVSANIGDELGESSDTTWKIYAYTNNPTDPWGEATSFVPGTCYWLYQRVGRDVQFNIGAGTSNSLKSFSITLNPGWNLIGNPYPFKSPIALDPQTYYGPITFTGSDTALTGWTGIVNNLAPWGGYAVYNRTAANQTLVFNALPREGTGKQLAKETGESIEGWLLQLKAVGETYADVANAIGRLEGATEQLDYFDNPEPPYIDGFVSLAMERDDWGANLPRFTSDIRSIGENDGVWDLELFVKGEKDPITLSHYLQGDLPPGNRIILLDVMTREVHDLLADDRPLTLTGYREDFPYHLKVVAGSASYVEYTTKEILASLPSDFSLAQNYPNPFNPVTHLRYSLFQPARVTLKIYNLLGQEVVTLVDGWQDLGHYEVIWEGRDRFGAQAASGIYFAAYMAEGRLFTRKMVLMK